MHHEVIYGDELDLSEYFTFQEAMAGYGVPDCEERVKGFCGEDGIQEEVVE